MLKKKIYLCCFLFSFSAYSKNPMTLLSTEKQLQNTHYYGGIGIGGITGQFQINSSTAVQPSAAFFNAQSSNPQTTNTNILGSIFFGKLLNINYFSTSPFFIAPEIYVNFGAPKSTWTQSANLLFPTEYLTTNHQTRLNSVEAGIDARLGTPVNTLSLIYARIGVSFNQLINNTAAVDSRPLIPLSTTINNSFRHTYSGLRLGAGLEQTVTSSLSIRGDYIFTVYPTVSKNVTGTPLTSTPGYELGPIENQTKIQTNTQIILISLAYRWNQLNVK